MRSLASESEMALKYCCPFSAVAFEGSPQPVSGWVCDQGRGVQTPGWVMPSTVKGLREPSEAFCMTTRSGSRWSRSDVSISSA